MSEFKVGDKVRRIIRGQSFGNPPMRLGDIGNITDFNGDKGVYVKGYPIANLIECLELVEEKQELIENKTKMNVDDLKGVDKKILLAAKEEVAKERADKQQKDAEEILRQLYEEKDEAEAVVKANGIDLKEINKKLKVFDGKQ